LGYIEGLTKELYDYLPPLTRKEDFDDFWERTVRHSRSVPLRSDRRLTEYPSRHVRVYDISYDGMDGTRIRGWYLVPGFAGDKRLPCLIHYHGFTHHRGVPSDFMHWMTMGFAVVSIDCREQGGSTGHGSPSTNGYATNLASKGVHDKSEYYYRYVYMDCVRAIDFAAEQAEVDAGRIVVEGASQGGALGMAAAALDDRPALAMVDVPSNSNLEKRVEGYHGAFASVADYLKIRPERTDSVFDTLSYFDTMNLAERIRCPVFASVALKDEVCPALMYFATYNRIPSEKEMVVYPFNGHEGGGAKHTEAKLDYLATRYSDWFAE